MNDFEDRLSAALNEGAEHAPQAVGLADVARKRARARRRRGRVITGAVVAVAAIVVPLGVVSSLGDEDPDEAIAPPVARDAGPGWKTVEIDLETRQSDPEPYTVLVDVPADWVELDSDGACAYYLYGVPSDPCAEVEMMSAVTDGGNLDYQYGPGLHPRGDFRGKIDAAWIGYVNVGDADVGVASDDKQVALRVLGSARLEGEGIPDLAGSWPLVVDQKVAYQAPAWGGPYSVAVRRGGGQAYAYAEQVSPGLWSAEATVGQRRIVVRAPTQALAELVAGSAYVGLKVSPILAPEWQTIEYAGIEVDVPGEWTELDTAECDVSTAGVADFEVGLPRPPTSGIHPCAATLGLRISEVTRFDPTVGLTDSGGEVVVGDQLLQILIGDRELARRILASARPTGTAPIGVVTWSVINLGNSVTAEVPDGADVQVARTGGIPDCADGSTPSPAQPTEDGQWRAGHCRNVRVSVVAPTEALATIIAATVDDNPR